MSTTTCTSFQTEVLLPVVAFRRSSPWVIPVAKCTAGLLLTMRLLVERVIGLFQWISNQVWSICSSCILSQGLCQMASNSQTRTRKSWRPTNITLRSKSPPWLRLQRKSCTTFSHISAILGAFSFCWKRFLWLPFGPILFYSSIINSQICNGPSHLLDSHYLEWY